MTTRKPAVAGKFYPSSDKALKAEINQVFKKEKNSIRTELAGNKIFGGVSPHAGYMFSAYQAVHLFQIIKEMKTQPETFVILHPDHYGAGPGIALDEHDAWETPLGTVPLDLEFMKNLPYESSSLAHQSEHSGEVMLPFLQFFLSNPFQIVPVALTRQDYKNASELAKSMEKAAKDTGRNIFIIASSDFSHFVDPASGEKLDDMVLKQIRSWNTEEVYNTILKHNITVCGYGPIMALMEYTHNLATDPQNEILTRGHSGNVMPSNEVVDYVSMIFYDKT